MAKDSDRKRGRLDVEETGGGLSGLLAEEDEFDRRTLWRLGTWAAISVGAVVVALVTNQSSIGLRREQIASIDLMKQAQQLQLTAKESRNENHRLASAVDTLNGDRDRLYARVAVLEQGLDSVTGAISRQAPAPSLPPTSSSPAKAGQASASAIPSASSSAPPPPASAPATAAAATAPVAPTVTASTAPAVTASAELPPAASKPAPPAPVVAPAAATTPVTSDKKDKQASTTVPPEPSSAMKLANAQQSASVQPFGYLMAPKSMMAPPDPAAEKLIEPTSPPRQASPPKTFTSAPMPEIAAVAPKASEEKASEEEKVLEKKTSEAKAAGENEPDSPPELVARRTEFGVDVGGANSVPGLRALWRGLLKSRSNAALATLRPIIVIKENNNGLGMQLRLVAGPINDAAAAAKICASLTVSGRGCSTTVFEGQRLSMGADEQSKVNTRTSSETKPATEARPEAENKPKYAGHRHYAPKRQAKEDDPPPPPPKEEQPSTLSLIFGKH